MVHSLDEMFLTKECTVSANSKLREHYIRTQKYLGKFPNDLLAKESFNQFLLSLRQTNTANWEAVTNPNLTELENESLKDLYEKKEPKKDRRRHRDEDGEDFHPGDHFSEEDIIF